MTGRSATTSMDGTPISQADVQRIEAEVQLHAEQKRKAARVIAGASNGVEDCRLLLDILGLDPQVVRDARRTHAARTGSPRRRTRAA